MTILNFSFTGENTTGACTFTTTREYKFKNLYLKDIKYSIRNDKLEEEVDKMTAGAGLSGTSATITSALGLHMNFLDGDDCITYAFTDSGVGTPANIVGLIPFGHAGGDSTNVADTATVSHSYPYQLIHNRPQTWASGKTLTFTLYFRDVQTDGLIKAWAAMSGTTDAFSDICDIDITLELI